jgi:ferredoxin
VEIRVDADVCELHGECVFNAPDLFRFNDDGELEYRQEVPDELRTQARTAATVCPTGAVELVE